MDRFEKLTIIVVATNEQESLKKTIDILMSLCEPDLTEEIVILLISDTCPAAKEADSLLKKDYPIRLTKKVQTLKGLSPCIHEGGNMVRSSHFLIIGSDLEMDPNSVPDMIAVSKTHPETIVCASKFKKRSKRKGYGLFHMLCARTVNTVVCLILGIKGTELITTFQIYPKKVFDKMAFDNPDYTFYEYTIKPVYLGIEYMEIPTEYKRRTEGESTFNLIRYFKLAYKFIYSACRLRIRLKRAKRVNH